MKICINCNFRFERPDWCCPRCGYQPDQTLGYPQFAPEWAQNAEGFDASYFAELFRYESGNFWFESRNALIIWAIQKYFAQAQQFMEVGCGTGFVLRGLHQAIPSLQLAGSEIFNEGLKIIGQRVPSAALYQMDILKIPFENEFDVLGAFDVLEHIPDDEGALGQLYQAVKPKGGIVLTVPQHPRLWSAFDTYAHHQRRYTRTELTQKVERAGFQVRFVTSFVSFLLPAMLLSRMRNKEPSSGYDVFAEFRIHALPNRILKEVLSVERFFIEHSVSMPAGGSLLLVAARNAS